MVFNLSDDRPAAYPVINEPMEIEEILTLSQLAA